MWFYKNRRYILVVLSCAFFAGYATHIVTKLLVMKWSIFSTGGLGGIFFIFFFFGAFFFWYKINHKILLYIIRKQMELAHWSVAENEKILKAITRLERGFYFHSIKDALLLMTNLNNRKYHSESIYIGIKHIIKLANDNIENQYICCTKLLCAWLKKYQADRNIVPESRQKYLICEFIRQNFDGRDLLIENYMSENDCIFWLDLSGMEFGDANFSNANFLGVNLSETDLSYADMSKAKGLTVEQILSARWSYCDEPPKLPKELLVDERIQKWLSDPHNDRKGE